MATRFEMAVLWFERRDYRALRGMLDAPEQLPGTYESWVRIAQQRIALLVRNDVITHPVTVTSDDLQDFCELTGVRPTVSACELIASAKLALSIANQGISRVFH